MTVCIAPNPKRLLIVEDDPDLQRVLSHLLTREGHSISTATSVIPAIAACQTEDLDLIILDLTLLDGTATEVIRWLQSNKQDPIIVIYTALDLSESEYRFFRSASQHIFIKCRVDPIQFQQTIFQLLAEKALSFESVLKVKPLLY